jgi:hypothetical protein
MRYSLRHVGGIPLAPQRDEQMIQRPAENKYRFNMQVSARPISRSQKTARSRKYPKKRPMKQDGLAVTTTAHNNVFSRRQSPAFAPCPLHEQDPRAAPSCLKLRVDG